MYRKMFSTAVTAALVLFSLAACTKKASMGFVNNGMPNNTGGNFTLPPPPPPSTPGTGTGSAGGVPYAGQGNQTPNPNQQNIIGQAGQVVQSTAPKATSPLTQEEIDLLNQILAGMNAGQDTTALRLELMGKLILSCTADISNFNPLPGEPMTGVWGGACADTGAPFAMTVFGVYPQMSAGVPYGAPQLFLTALDPGDIHAGLVQTQANGDASGLVTGTYGTYRADMTDRPQAATGVGTLVAGGTGVCPTAPAALVASANPIPAKYTEGINRLAQCYRQALVFASPILSKYVYNLSPESSQWVLSTLNLQ